MYDDTLSTLLDKHAPRRVVRRRHQLTTPWFDSDCAGTKHCARIFERQIQVRPKLDGFATAVSDLGFPVLSFSGNRVAVYVAPRQPTHGCQQLNECGGTTLKGPCTTLGGSTVTVKPRRRRLMTSSHCAPWCVLVRQRRQSIIIICCSQQTCHLTLKSAYTDDC